MVVMLGGAMHMPPHACTGQVRQAAVAVNFSCSCRPHCSHRQWCPSCR